MTATMKAPRIATGMMMLNDQVRSSHTNSQPGGTRRSAPSATPMYQSGWVPAETGEGPDGPYVQIGLMVNSAAMSATTPNTMKKKPPAFAAYTGRTGYPTTLPCVRPGAAYCVCLWMTTNIRCSAMNATTNAGNSRMCSV